MIKHQYLQKRFKKLHKYRIYERTDKVSESQQISNLNANLNFCKRMMYNYFGDRQELE